jgi:hypothetical protein
MSETTVGREPIQIVKLVLPRCTNVAGTSPCTATETGNAKCFNTRSTCNDPDNYRSRPDAGIAYDFARPQGGVIASDDLTRTANVFGVFKVSFPLTPDGIVWEQGSDANGVFVGCHSDTWFEVRAGFGGASPTSQTVQVRTPIANVAGKTLFIYVFIDHGARQLRVWGYDPVENEYAFSGDDTASSWPSGGWSGSDPGAIGRLNGFGTFGTTNNSFNGRIIEARFAQTGFSLPDMNALDYKTELYFSRKQDQRPSDSLYILPFVRSISTVGSKINLAGTSKNYEPLGKTATMTIDLEDPPHTDRGVDPYLADRTYDPLTRSTFWRKFLTRQKFGKLHARVVLYDGYAGQALSVMKRREYVVNDISFQGDTNVRIQCRDVLSLSNIDKAQLPVASPGQLRGALTTTATVVDAIGATRADYELSGIIKINNELIEYEGLTDNATGDGILFTGLTRGSGNTEAAEHGIEDGVQACEVFESASVEETLWKLCAAADIDYQMIDFDNWTANEYFNGYALSTILTEPAAVKRLLGEVCESAGVYLFFNEREQSIQLRGALGIDAANTTISTYSDEFHIIEGSFNLKERPNEYISQYWLHYSQRDTTKQLTDKSNYRFTYVKANVDVEGPNKYGRRSIREIYSRWIQDEAVAKSSAGRQSNLRKEVPTEVVFAMDAKDRDLWVGDVCQLDHADIVDANGMRDTTRRWLIIEAEEYMTGESVRYKAEDITPAGFLFFIQPAGAANYSGSNPDYLLYVAPTGTTDDSRGVIQ